MESKTPARRILIHIPIFHTSADLGALGIRIRQQLIKTFGERWWQGNLGSVERVWDEIEAALNELDLPYPRLRIYQDGLPVCGRELDIITELAAAGSRNHRLLLELRRRGGEIVGTESGELLTEEYSRIKGLLETSASPSERRPDVKASGARLIEKRDRFIASRIDSTLHEDEIGMLFLGMLHSIAPLLAKDIKFLNLLPFDRNARQIKRALQRM
jgi:hypothetical protein